MDQFSLTICSEIDDISLYPGPLGVCASTTSMATVWMHRTRPCQHSVICHRVDHSNTRPAIGTGQPRSNSSNGESPTDARKRTLNWLLLIQPKDNPYSSLVFDDFGVSGERLAATHMKRVG